MTKLYEPISKESIFDEINGICSTTYESYSHKKKVAHVNEALDAYWFLVSESAPQGTADDTSNTSAPIETQSLVAGTNNYKVATFTNEVLNILRVSVLDADADEYDLIYEDFEDVQDFAERYSTDTDKRGTPTHWTKLGDFIYITPCPDYAEANGLRCYANRELSKFSYVTFTTTFASDLFTTSAVHGLSAKDGLIFVTDTTIPSGITADTVVYYVIASGLTTDDFKVSTTISGSTITLADNGTGNHKYVKVSGEPGIPVIHHSYLARYAADKFMDAEHPKFAKNRADLAQDRLDIQDYWQSRGRMGRTIIETNRRLFK